MKKALICIVVVLLFALLTAVTAYGQSWNSAVTEGITAVYASLDTSTNTWTWVLTNTSSTPACPVPDHVLVWKFQPFNVYEVVSWTAPAGWVWETSGWQNYEIANNNRKYYTPPAIAPGKSAIFTYKFNPSGKKINPFPQGYCGDPDAIGFITHVGAVIPGSGSLDGSVRWKESKKSDLWEYLA